MPTRPFPLAGWFPWLDLQYVWALHASSLNAACHTRSPVPGRLGKSAHEDACTHMGVFDYGGQVITSVKASPFTLLRQALYFVVQS